MSFFFLRVEVVIGRIFGEGPMSLFVTGAIFGEFCKIMWHGKIFPPECDTNLCCAAGCRLTGTVLKVSRKITHFDSFSGIFTK